MPARKSLAAPAAVFAAALVIRLVYLWQISSAPFFPLRLGDAEAYHQWAHRIAAGEWLGHEVFYQAPLYPYLLAIVYRIAGDSVMLVRILQAFLGGAACALLAIAGRRLFGGKGILAGVLLAIYPPTIFLDALLEKSALSTLLTAALLALLATRRWLFAGIVLGLLALTRENALLLAIPIALWIAWDSSARRALPFLAACALTLLPVGIRNSVVGGEFHLTTSQFGPNFYIGNHAGASGFYDALAPGHGNAGDEREDATLLAEAAAGHKLSPGGVSAWWTTRALDFIRTQPAQWLALTVKKLAATFNAAEASDTESQQVYADQSLLLRLLEPFHFGVLLALAVLGIVLTATEWRKLSLFYAIAITYALSVAAFFVFARYRFPLAIVLMLPAAGALAAIRTASRRTLVISAVAALAAIVFARIPLFDEQPARATHYAGIAAALSRDPAETDVAMSYYQRALDADPRFPAAAYGMGTMLARTARHDQAIPYFERAVAAWPDYEEAHYNLGISLDASGRSPEAATEFRAALRLRPNDADAHLALAKSLLSIAPPEAVDEYRRGLALRPNDGAALVGLGVALTNAGRPKEAIAQYEQALTLDPRNAAAHNSLGWTLATEGRLAEAIPHFERALELHPNDEAARRNLEQARQFRSK